VPQRTGNHSVAVMMPAPQTTACDSEQVVTLGPLRPSTEAARR
jgi:hypothetical protein